MEGPTEQGPWIWKEVDWNPSYAIYPGQVAMPGLHLLCSVHIAYR